MTSRDRQRGIALITVIWLLVILAGLAVALGSTARTETHLARNVVDAARARHLAEAGIERAVLALLDAREAPRLRPDGSRGIEFRMGGGLVRATVVDECGKIDLNTAWAELVRGAVHGAGLGAREADELVDAILDWRDPDDHRRARGAERREYERAGKPGPRNAPFATVEELQQVIGMTPDLYRKLEPVLTVLCLQSGVDARVAPAAALRAVPGIRDREVDNLVAQRRRSLERNDPLPEPGLSGIARYVAQSPGNVYTVHSTATLENGAQVRLEAQVWVLPDGERPYATLSLREGRGAAP